MDVAIEGSEHRHSNVFWPKVRIRLALAFLEKCLDLIDFHSLIVIAVKHLEDACDCLISHLILLEGFDGMCELTQVKSVV